MLCIDQSAALAGFCAPAAAYAWATTNPKPHLGEQVAGLQLGHVLVALHAGGHCRQEGGQRWAWGGAKRAAVGAQWASRLPAAWLRPGSTGWRPRLGGWAPTTTDGGGGSPERRIGAMRTLTLLGSRHALHGEAASMLPLAAAVVGMAERCRERSVRQMRIHAVPARCMSCRAMRRGELPPREPHLPAAATRRRALANWVDRATMVLLRRDRRRAVRAGRVQMVPAASAAARLATWANFDGWRASAALYAVSFALQQSPHPVSWSSSQL